MDIDHGRSRPAGLLDAQRDQGQHGAVPADPEPRLRVDDPDQVAALHEAVYTSARTTGLGPDRARRVADHVTRHLAGRLHAHGYRLTLSWVSPDAQAALEQARRYYDSPPDPT